MLVRDIKVRVFKAEYCLAAVSNAFAVLSNAEKREKYDRYGADEDQVSNRRSHADYTRGFEGGLCTNILCEV